MRQIKKKQCNLGNISFLRAFLSKIKKENKIIKPKDTQAHKNSYIEFVGIKESIVGLDKQLE